MLFNLLAQEASPPMPAYYVIYGIGILVLLALVLGVSALNAHRKLSWSASLSQGLGTLLWASPVIAVMALVGIRVVPYFQFGAVSHKAPDTQPSWLQSETGETVNVNLVESFPEKTFPVSLDLDDAPSNPDVEAAPEGTIQIGEAPNKNPEAALPEWVTKEVVQLLTSTKGKPHEEVWRITIESGKDEADWLLSEADARASLAAKAGQLIAEDFRRFYPGGADLPLQEIPGQIVKQELVTRRTFGKDSAPFTGYKAYWQIELSPKVRAELSDTWKSEVAMRRAELFAGMLGLFTLIAGAFAAYFHLDKKSNGNYRFRLKLAATALMTAGGLGLLAALSCGA